MRRFLREAPARLLNRYRQPKHGAVVLLYHRIAGLRVDPWGMAVRPDHFAGHLDVISRYCTPLSSRDLVRRLAAGDPCAGCLAVTFDDGYADLRHAALPLLQNAAVPATMFITTGAVDADHEFWWDAVERALLHDRPLPERLELTIAHQVRGWTLARAVPVPHDPSWRAWNAAPSAREETYAAVWEALIRLGGAERARVVRELLTWAGLPADARPTHRTLAMDELRQLAASPLIDIGAHTVSHPSLPALPPHAQREEVAGSRHQLRTLLGHEIATFAYPFGTPAHVDTHAMDAVRRAGFEAAFLNVPGRVTRGSDRYTLPRIFVDDMDDDAFCRLLWQNAGIRTG